MRNAWFLSLLLATPLATAQIYRWVDEAGVTQFSQSPPPDRTATTIRPPPEAGIAPEAARRTFQERVLQGVDDYLEDRSLAAQRQAQAQERHAQRERQCQAARQNQAHLEQTRLRRVRLPDGGFVELTEAERARRLAEAQESIRQYCP